MRTLSTALVLLAIGVGSAGAVARDSSTTTRLTLDGDAIRPELALNPASRSLGLMNRRKAPVDGMLFVFPEPTSGGFWMKNTLIPLTIVFYDRNGNRVKRMSMVPCREDPCRIYDPGRMYRFALELRAAETRIAKRLGPLSTLRRLVKQAR